MDCILEWLKILNDNQQAIYSLIMQSDSESVIVKLNELEILIEENQKKLVSKINKINTKLDEVTESQTICCSTMNEKLDYIVDYINGTDIEEWASGISYKIGDLCSYEKIDYCCIQAHKSQDDWVPNKAVSLWVVYDVVEEK